MIFFTVGTEQFPFERFIRAADLVAEKFPKEEVFAQIAENQFVPKLAKWERWLPYSEFAKRIADARIVVSHAGAGSLLSCAWIDKVAITLPRLHALGEHVDDHQVELANKMSGLGHAFLAHSPEEVLDLVQRYDQAIAQNRETRTSEPSLANALDRWLMKEPIR